MQYCSLQHWTLLPSQVTYTVGCWFCFVSISSFFLELFLHSSSAAYWATTDLGSSSFSIIFFSLFILVMSQCQIRCWNQINYILHRLRWRGIKHSAKTRLGADCGSDHEYLIAKFRLKLKKVGKTPRPFSYGLNKMHYNYTVEVKNRFKELDLIQKVPEDYGQRFMTLYRRQGSIPSQEKEMQKSKMAVWGRLTNSCEKKRSKRQRRKGKNIPIWMQSSKDWQGEIRKPSSAINAKK